MWLSKEAIDFSKTFSLKNLSIFLQESGKESEE